VQRFDTDARIAASACRQALFVSLQIRAALGRGHIAA
jgi:hypothetical protein